MGAGDDIFKPGDLVDRMVVCVQGSMFFESSVDGKKENFEQGEVFGPKYLFPVKRDTQPLEGRL